MQDPIGKGGMGVVYRARHLGLDKIVAVKVLPPKFANDPQFVERFLREARAAGRLNQMPASRRATTTTSWSSSRVRPPSSGCAGRAP
ncbi:MAG: hypothetical protein ACYTGX_08000 [Planctomycetota bacterium]|jgi:serine/threonine protein kinase